ncbi:MAG: TetR/AcrR family transcriptional regulator [Bradymonadaceae bacterium]
MERKSTEERREEIVDAFLATMAEHGYAKATIAKIARQADLTGGLVHYHFRNKQAILMALLERLVDRQTSLLTKLVDEVADPVEELRLLIAGILGTGSSADPAAVAAWVTIAAESIRQPEVSEAFGQAIRALGVLFEKNIEAGIEEGVFDAGSLTVEACVGAILATIQGYFTLAATARDVIPTGSAAPATWRMIEGLLGISPRP